MADYERRNGNYRGGYNNRKRRYRDDDEHDHRPQRRKYDEPAHVKVRREILGIAESPHKRAEEEIASLAKTIIDHLEDEKIKSVYLDLSVSLVAEQPLKIPFLAGLVLAINAQKPDLSTEILAKAADRLQTYVNDGSWTQAKLLLRFLGCLQKMLDGDGVFPLLESLFERAVDLQTASSEDSLGLELVKIILLTIPYIMATSADSCAEQALALLDKTDVIASTPHMLYALVNPYFDSDAQPAQDAQSVIALLQKQLQAEAEQGWRLACLPRPYNPMEGFNASDDSTIRHVMPRVDIPSPVIPGPRPRFPEVYLSIYGDQDIETVPPTSDITSCITRDVLIDTINLLDCNRNATARFLIDLDCYFAPDTFVKRATQFDKLRDIEDGRSTWKPEDVVVDAVFSQLLQLPLPEHKLVYYHSVLTEACKIAPAAIAPSLGRAIRWLYQHIDALDIELVYRFTDWFAHHLSNFGFTWKWTEWVDDVSLSTRHTKKAFIVGSLEKEIRLSFAARIRGTLPEPYQSLISEAKEEDVPPFKYNVENAPYAEPAREILRLLKSKAADSELDEPLNAVQALATEQNVPDTSIPTTDAYVTAICYIGSKSLSHALSQIERCKDRLAAIGLSSETGRRQIITSVMDYWKEKPGTGINIVDKLLNYTILTPESVIHWALVDQLGKGDILNQTHIYEMVAATVRKVTTRVRQIVTARNAAGLPDDQREILDNTLARERQATQNLFELIEDALVGVAESSNDAMAESADVDGPAGEAISKWGIRWLRAIRRKRDVEAALVIEMLNAPPIQAQAEVQIQQTDGDDNGTMDGIATETTNGH